MQQGVCLRDERGENERGREGRESEREGEESGHEKVLDAFANLFNVQSKSSGGEIFHS